MLLDHGYAIYTCSRQQACLSNLRSYEDVEMDIWSYKNDKIRNKHMRKSWGGIY